ncbi:hypothetical protein FRC01_001287 [Tulasnella sp. 417]|nr:hypothetical protein FRC01_001287 [Tulasnella sp. 417]
MAHRDTKPQKIIIFVSKTDGMATKLSDIGIARPYPEPLVENWFAGTTGWAVPSSFMTSVFLTYNVSMARGESRIKSGM